MPNHKQPTKEELKAIEEAAIAEAEKLVKNPPKEEETPKTETPDDDGTQPELPVTPEEKEEETPESEKEDQAEPSKEVKERLKIEVEEKKKKLAASARENQKIYAKNRVINKALTDADEIPEPTEEELVSEFKEWEFMTDTEKLLAKETLVSKNWRKLISQAKDQATKIEKWNESVETFIDDPVTLNDNPELEGKTEEFKTFAQEEANNSVPFKILVSAFLHDHSIAKKSNKGRMFEKGSGGPNEKPELKNGKITLEEGRKLRETNYDLWKEKLSAGLIESDL